jgi:SAM-dependent methyltransferase
MIRRLLQKFDPDAKFILRRLYSKLRETPEPNTKGEREIEFSWIATNMPEGPGQAFDFGCGAGFMGILTSMRGFNVTACDLEPARWFFEHPSLHFVQGDILESNFPQKHFDLIINCSSIEHVGLAGRYSVSELRANGDIEAMGVLKSIIKTNGVMIFTVPVGRDKVYAPLHRVYGKKRLPLLLEGWRVQKKEFWIKDTRNKWVRTEESVALNKETIERCYGLGLFVLSPS